MIDARALIRAAFAILFSLCAMPGTARACESSAAMRYYFTTVPPALTPDIMFVRVTIVSRTYTSVEARLEGRFASLSTDHLIHIELPEPPDETNCVDWGTLEGPVYVVASSALVRDGHAAIIAEPVKWNDFGADRELERLRRNAQVTYPAMDAARR